MTDLTRTFVYQEFTPFGAPRHTISGPVAYDVIEPLWRLLLDVAEGKVDGEKLERVLEEVK
jgi:hypothetical protein